MPYGTGKRFSNSELNLHLMAESSYVEIRMVARLAENIETKEILVAGGDWNRRGFSDPRVDYKGKGGSLEPP